MSTQHGPTTGSGQIRVQRKSRVLVMPDERLGLDRHEVQQATASVVANTSAAMAVKAVLLDATRTILRRADEEIDIPAAGGRSGGSVSPHRLASTAWPYPIGLAVPFDDAAECGGAFHGECDLRLGGGAVAPVRCNGGIGQPAPKHEAIGGGRGAQGDGGADVRHRNQCRKCRMPVKTMARPFSSAALMTSRRAWSRRAE